MTIYLHIWADKTSGGDLYHLLRRKGKACQPRSKAQAGRGHIKNRVIIDKRETSFAVSKRINDKSAHTVTIATITADNGKEFAFHELMTQALGARRSTLQTLTVHGGVD